MSLVLPITSPLPNFQIRTSFQIQNALIEEKARSLEGRPSLLVPWQVYMTVISPALPQGNLWEGHLFG